MQTQSTAIPVFGTEEKSNIFRDNETKDLCLRFLQYLILRLTLNINKASIVHEPLVSHFWFPRSLQPAHLDDLDGLFDLLQFLRPLLDQVFELRSLLSEINLRGQKSRPGLVTEICPPLKSSKPAGRPLSAIFRPVPSSPSRRFALH